MRFSIDECLHTTLVEVARELGHEAQHVNWLGLSGATDWGLMPRILEDDSTFVTNNARDFLKLYARQPNFIAGLIVGLAQVPPARQRQLFHAFLEELGAEGSLINEVVEIELEGEVATFNRYALPAPG